MKIRTLIPATALLLLSLGASHAQTLFSDNFDTDNSANWTSRLSGSDAFANYYFDYSTLGIPSAPNSVGGTTRGMRFLANQGLDPATTAGVQQGITGYPNGQSFTGNYRLRFDMWLSFNGPAPAGGSGSTQCGSFGIGATGAAALWAGASANGLMFAATGDGGSSIDYRAYYNNALRPPADGVYAAGTHTTAYNDTDPYYAGLGGHAAPAAQVSLYPQQSGTTATGALGWKWRDVVVEKNGNTVTWKVDDRLLATVDVSLITNFSTNIFFGIFDINATASSDPNDLLIAAIYDNVRVEALAGPQIDIVSTGDATEGGAAGGFTISRTGSTASPLTVNFVVGGTATPTADYPALPSSITFGVGQASSNLTVTAVDDIVPEFTETVTINISNSTNYLIGTGSATVLIFDNETPELSITALSPSMYERVVGDYAQFQVSRKGSLNNSIFPNISYSGTAAPGRYSGPTSFAMNPGLVTVTFDVTPIDNATLNGDQTVIATIASGSGYVAGTTNSATTILLDDELPAETVLFADTLSTNSSANWTRRFGANNLVDDYNVDWAYDVSGDGINAAPNGSTTALKMTVNKTDATANGAAGINFYPNGQSFSGDYALRFSMYLSQNLSVGTTEFAQYGINHSGNKTNWVRLSTGGISNPPLDSDGLWYMVSADASGSTPGDFALMTGTNAANSASVLSTINASSFRQAFKKPPYSAGAGAGSPANIFTTGTPTWADVEVKKIGSVVTMSINKTQITQYTNTTPFTSGNIMLGYSDPYDSIGNGGGQVYFSNVRVVNLTTTVVQPNITSTKVINSGTQVQIDFTGSPSDTFTLLSSGVVAGPYTTTAATIVSTGGNTFRATTAVNGSARFYRLRVN